MAPRIFVHRTKKAGTFVSLQIQGGDRGLWTVSTHSDGHFIEQNCWPRYFLALETWKWKGSLHFMYLLRNVLCDTCSPVSQNAEEDYQLWFSSGKEEAPCPLLGKCVVSTELHTVTLPCQSCCCLVSRLNSLKEDLLCEFFYTSKTQWQSLTLTQVYDKKTFLGIRFCNW